MPTTLQEFVDEIAPDHERTSCSDEESNGNEFYNEFGIPRCIRCAMLHRLKYREWPHGTTARVHTLVFSGDSRITEKYR